MAFSINGFDITVNRFDFGVDILFNVKNRDGTPFDLTGYKVQFILKKEAYQDDESAVYNLMLDGEDSQIRIPLVSEMTGGEVGTYHYALRLYRDDVFVNTFLQAKFNISCNVFSEAVDE